VQELKVNGTKIHLSQEKVDSLVNQKDVKDVIAKVKKASNKILDLKVNDSFLFEVLDKNNELVSGTGLVLANNNMDVFVNIFEEETNGQKGLTVSSFYPETIGEEDFINKLVYRDGKQVKSIVKPLTEKIKDVLKVNGANDLFPVNEQFEKQSMKNDFNAEYDYPPWYWGCLPGGYLWCGGDCDNFEDQGGNGYWINDTD
jgi:hypothetical protein